MEREWREASDMRQSTIGLGIVLAVAALLRFWAIGSGIPYAVGPDEPEVMTRVVRMMTTGDFNPHFFDYPSLYIYVQLAVACVHFILGASAGAWGSLASVSDADFYLWGRVVTATLGTATVGLVYMIGSRWGARHALLAAGLLAVMPNHVRESHFVLTDVPMTFFTTLSFLLTLRALEKETLRAFAWAGAVAGLAAGTKYYGGIVLVAPLLAAYFASGAQRSRLLLALSAVGACIGCFLLVAPYTVLDLPGFLNGFATLSSSLAGRAAVSEAGWRTYLKHLTIGLSAGSVGRWTGYAGMLFLFWGLIHSVVRGITGPGQPRFILLILFPLLFFVVLSDRTLIYARYLMPLFPFVALLIAIAIISAVTFLRRFNIPRTLRSTAIVLLTVVAIVPPGYSAVNWDINHAKPSTYSAAYRWIVEHVPTSSGVVIETGSFRLPASYKRVAQVKNLTDRDYASYVADKVEYAVLLSNEARLVFDSPQVNPGMYGRYRQMLDHMALAAVFRAAPGDFSPDIRIFRLLNGAASADLPAVVKTGT